MRYQDTVFGGLMKAFPRWRFDALVARHGADHRVRRLPSWSQFVAMLYAQLSGSRSLREVIAALERFPSSHAHLGLKPVRRSTLSDANRLRPAALFEDVLAALVGQLGGAAGKRGREILRLIDATRVVVGKRIESWQVDGCVKLHVVYDPEVETPVCFAVTSARVNDITPAKRFPIEPGATYVFDKGYYDFGFWAALDGAGCRFVTRLKKNSPLAVVETRAVAPGGAVLADRVGFLSPAPGGQPRQPLRQAGPGHHRAHRHRPGDHPSHQRPGHAGRTDCRALQAALADRAVLQMDQAEPQDQTFPGGQRERGAHPDPHRPDRLCAAAPRPDRDRNPRSASRPSHGWSPRQPSSADR